MLIKILRSFSLVLLIAGFSFASFSLNPTFAKSPDDECAHAEEAGLSCKVCGDCAVVYTREGEQLCKVCGEYECTLDDCANCSDSDCATEE